MVLLHAVKERPLGGESPESSNIKSYKLSIDPFTVSVSILVGGSIVPKITANV